MMKQVRLSTVHKCSTAKTRKTFRSIRRRSLSLPLPNTSRKNHFRPVLNLLKYGTLLISRTIVPACHHNVSGEDARPTSYSNKSRGLREKQDNLTPDGQPLDETNVAIEIIDISEYKPRRIPSKQWRECIKKIYETDPLCCPKCGGEMKIISFITDQQVIRQILKHLGLWTPTPSRDPPNTNSSPKNHELVYEFFDDLSAFNTQADDWPGYDESCIAQN